MLSTPESTYLVYKDLIHYVWNKLEYSYDMYYDIFYIHIRLKNVLNLIKLILIIYDLILWFFYHCSQEILMYYLEIVFWHSIFFLVVLQLKSAGQVLCWCSQVLGKLMLTLIIKHKVLNVRWISSLFCVPRKWVVCF